MPGDYKLEFSSSLEALFYPDVLGFFESESDEASFFQILRRVHSIVDNQSQVITQQGYLLATPPAPGSILVERLKCSTCRIECRWKPRLPSCNTLRPVFLLRVSVTCARRFKTSHRAQGYITLANENTYTYRPNHTGPLVSAGAARAEYTPLIGQSCLYFPTLTSGT